MIFRRPSLRDFLYGLIGGAIVTLVLYVATGFLGLPFPPEAIFMLFILPVQGSIQSIAVDFFGEYAKYSAFTAAAATFSIIYGLIAVLLGLLLRRRRLAGYTLTLLIAALIPTLLGIVLDASLASQSSILSSYIGWVLSAGLLVVVNLAYGLFVIRGAWPQTFGLVKPTTAVTPKPSVTSARRSFLKKATIAAAILVAAGIAAKIGLTFLSGQPLVTSGTAIPVNSQPNQPYLTGLPSVFSDPRIADLVGSEVTDDRLFYRVDINAIPPQLNFDQWSLSVHGKVDKPFVLDMNGLMALPSSDEYATLECVSNTINPPSALISNAKWTGVPLSTILNQAALTSDAKYIVFHSADGYTVGVPLDRAMEKGALLAYKMNDQVLPIEHGFPLRAIVPGLYGMMNAKWITEMEAADTVYLGYWQERGWTNDARIKTTSIIYYPPQNAQVNGPLPIAGVAFAGDRGISKVEVSTDGGQTWNQAELKPPKSPYAWVLWAYSWTPTAKGSQTILVRATDGTGQLQDSAYNQPFPQGATGYNTVTVTVS